MIVDPVPSLHRMAAEVWKPLTLLFVWDCVVTITYYVLPFKAPGLPLTIFGTGLALFLGFRSNSAYQRWWEGRTLWGAMINASRSRARATRNFLPDPAGRDLKREFIKRQIAYVNARVNVANGLLDSTGRRIDIARRTGWIDTIQQTQMEAVLVDIANAQGGMERLKNTPLPVQYRYLPTIFTHLFCLFLPLGLVETLGLATPLGSTVAGLMFLAVLRIGDDLVDPFANTVHDVPLNAMCRTIEIDLLQSIGDPAPEPLKPVRGVLW